MCDKSIKISIIAIVVSCATFLFNYTRLEAFLPNTNDLLITVLAILVTILIGWQIYNVLGIEKEIENIKKDIEEENKKNKKDIELKIKAIKEEAKKDLEEENKKNKKDIE